MIRRTEHWTAFLKLSYITSEIGDKMLKGNRRLKNIKISRTNMDYAVSFPQCATEINDRIVSLIFIVERFNFFNKREPEIILYW